MDNFISIFSSDECSERGGSVNGECALGYGVCCICKYTYFSILNPIYIDLRLLKWFLSRLIKDEMYYQKLFTYNHTTSKKTSEYLYLFLSVCFPEINNNMQLLTYF